MREGTIVTMVMATSEIVSCYVTIAQHIYHSDVQTAPPPPLSKHEYKNPLKIHLYTSTCFHTQLHTMDL